MKHDPEKRWLNKILPAVQAYSHAVVYSELVTFLNPKYRGPNFRYARLHAQEALDRSGILEWWGK